MSDEYEDDEFNFSESFANSGIAPTDVVAQSRYGSKNGKIVSRGFSLLMAFRRQISRAKHKKHHYNFSDFWTKFGSIANKTTHFQAFKKEGLALGDRLENSLERSYHLMSDVIPNTLFADNERRYEAA